MRNNPIAFLLALTACSTSAPPPAPAPIPPVAAVPSPPSAPSPYPATRRVDAKDVFHGVTVPDPYRWLEDGDSAEVKAWAKAQDALAQSRILAIPQREELLARIKEIMFAGEVQSPRRFGKRLFYERRDASREKLVVYMRDVRDPRGGAERPLIDPDRWPAEQKWTLQGYAPSPDGRKIAYKVSKNNADLSSLRVLDVDTGVDSAIDTIEPVSYTDPSWSADGRGFYYRLDPSDPTVPSNERIGRATVRYHRLGKDPKSDIVIREATMDSRKLEEVIASRDGRWLFLRTELGPREAEWHFRDASRPTARWTPLSVGRHQHYEVADHKGIFYVRTDEGAPRGRLLRVNPARPEREAWKEIVPEHASATLESFIVAGRKLLLQWGKDAASELEIRELDGSGARPVELPAIGTLGSMLGPTLSGRPEDDEVFVRFSSFAVPPAIHTISMKAATSLIWAKPEVADVDPSRYSVERVFSPSKDGVKVPMFVFRRRDVALDGRAPVLMRGYGGFGLSVGPFFAPAAFAWAERGGVIVEVAARGSNMEKHGTAMACSRRSKIRSTTSLAARKT